MGERSEELECLRQLLLMNKKLTTKGILNLQSERLPGDIYSFEMNCNLPVSELGNSLTCDGRMGRCISQANGC